MIKKILLAPFRLCFTIGKLAILGLINLLILILKGLILIGDGLDWIGGVISNILTTPIYAFGPALVLLFLFHYLYPTLGTTEVVGDKFREAPHVTYNKIKAASGFKTSAELVILPNADLRAYTNHRHIYMSQGFLDFLKSTDELAVILGHELGHIYQSHTFRTPLEPIAAEAESDRLGYLWASNAGYNACAISETFLRMGNTYGNHKTKTHPTNLSRVAANACLNIEIKEIK